MALTDGLVVLVRLAHSGAISGGTPETLSVIDKLSNPDGTFTATGWRLDDSDQSGSGWSQYQITTQATGVGDLSIDMGGSVSIGSGGEYTLLLAAQCLTGIVSSSAFLGLKDATGPTVSLARNGTEGRLTINHLAGNYYHTTSGFNWDTGSPQVFVLTFDGSTAKFYINGSQAGSDASSITVDPRSSFTHIKVFSYFFDDAPQTAYMRGYATAVWDRALSGAEVADLADLADCLALEALADGGGASAVPLLMMHYN